MNEIAGMYSICTLSCSAGFPPQCDSVEIKVLSHERSHRHMVKKPQKDAKFQAQREERGNKESMDRVKQEFS